MSRLIVHIGLMKAGSTTLQAVVRENKSFLDFVPTGALARWQMETKRDGWKSQGKNFVRIVKEVESTVRPVFASHESLSTLPLDSFAAMIARHWAEAKILVVTRNPGDYAKSLYRKNIRHGYASNLSQFLDERRGAIVRNTNYDFIQKTFGTYGIEVEFVPFELLKDDATAFFDIISSILSVPIKLGEGSWRNKSPSTAILEALLIANRVAEVFRPHDPSAFNQYKEAMYRLSSHHGMVDESAIGDLVPPGNGSMLAEQNSDVSSLMSSCGKGCEVLRDNAHYAPYLPLYVSDVK